MQLTIMSLQGILADARSAFGVNCIIAGGAVRDILNDKPVKDIDLFVKMKADGAMQSDEAAMKAASSLFQADCKMFDVYNGMFEDNYKSDLNFRKPTETDSGVAIVDLCFMTSSLLTIPIELIGILGDPVDDIHDYDFNISQCFITPRALFMTEACSKGMRDKQIIYMNGERSCASEQRSKRRLARLRAKYQDWTFLNCQQLDKLQGEEK